jgi:hypothetical protein
MRYMSFLPTWPDAWIAAGEFWAGVLDIEDKTARKE